MLKQRLSIAREVQDRLISAEKLNDQSIIASAELIIALLNGSQSMNAAAMVGQDAFAEMASALAAAGETRRRLVAAHAELAKVKERVGLATVALGGGASKDPSEFFTSGRLAVLDGGLAG